MAFDGSIGRGGVPERQHSIETEAIDRLCHAGLLNVACDRAQAERIQRDGSRRSQERQITEARRQLVLRDESVASAAQVAEVAGRSARNHCHVRGLCVREV